MPHQFKSFRMTDATVGNTIDNHGNDLEAAIAFALGIPLDTDITAPLLAGSPVRYASIEDSASLANPTVYTAYSKTYTIPANSLKVGDVIRVRAHLYVVRGTTTKFWRLLTLGGLTWADFGEGLNLTAGAHNAYIEATAIVRSIGAGGTFISLGGHGSDSHEQNVRACGGAGATAINTTATNVVSISVKFDTSDGGNSALLRSLIVEILPAGSTA